jgi:hypothetical protein
MPQTAILLFSVDTGGSLHRRYAVLRFEMGRYVLGKPYWTNHNPGISFNISDRLCSAAWGLFQWAHSNKVD